jgi:CelD/BcsL family acetyltransferase involved in cellulose biosynthesis
VKEGNGSEVISSLRELASLRDAWNELYKRCGANNIFTTFAWNSSWLNSFTDSYDSILLLTQWKERELSGVIPLVMKEESFYGFKAKQVTFAGGKESVYKDCLISGNPEGLLDKLLSHLGTELHKWDVLVLDSLPCDSETVGRLPGVSHSHHFHCISEQYGVSPYIQLPATYDEMHDNHRKRIRKNVKYQVRRLGKLGQVEFVCYWGTSIKTEHISEAARIERRSWKGGCSAGAFFDRQHLDFHSALLNHGSREFVPYLGILTHSGHGIAFVYGFRQDDCFYGYNMSYDNDFGSYSPGWIIIDYLVRELIAEGIRKFDLLAGGGPFKESWASGLSNIDRLIVFNRTPYALVLYNLYRMKNLLKRTPIYGLLRSSGKSKKEHCLKT